MGTIINYDPLDLGKSCLALEISNCINKLGRDKFLYKFTNKLKRRVLVEVLFEINSLFSSEDIQDVWAELEGFEVINATLQTRDGAYHDIVDSATVGIWYEIGLDAFLNIEASELRFEGLDWHITNDNIDSQDVEYLCECMKAAISDLNEL